jgi:DNA mismatch repair protein MutL
MSIRLLPSTLVNQIAAGEVVERPASVVKELVENALDAGATRIDVAIADGGLSLIAVTDNGVGMSRDDLMLAVQRHATSKLPGDDVMHIEHLGFRGEALPSIASVSRMTLTSRRAEDAHGWCLAIEAGAHGAPEPAACNIGTRIEVRDVFFAIPARLKFLKSERSEVQAVQDVMLRLAMTHPSVGFRLTHQNRSLMQLDAQQGDLLDAHRLRLGELLGRDFTENALPLALERDGVRLSGYVSLPTYAKATAAAQYFAVNQRPVRDRQLIGAVRGAYQDFLARDRHAVVALFIDLPPEMVDVNVHPAKAEVRFRNAGLIRGMIVGGIARTLQEAGHRASNTVAASALQAARPAYAPHFALPQPISQGLAETSARHGRNIGAPRRPPCTNRGCNDYRHSLPVGCSLRTTAPYLHHRPNRRRHSDCRSACGA